MAFWQDIPSFDLVGEDVEILRSAKQYYQRLIRLIEHAKSRIYITALYLQDDEAGREVLSALHKASLANPTLEVNVLVDFHGSIVSNDAMTTLTKLLNK